MNADEHDRTHQNHRSRRTPETPILDTLRWILRDTGLHPLITEDTCPQTDFCWRATLPGTWWVPPTSGRAVPQDGFTAQGSGMTREVALHGLVYVIRTRLKLAVHVPEVDVAARRYRWVAYMWSGARLVPMDSGEDDLTPTSHPAPQAWKTAAGAVTSGGTG